MDECRVSAVIEESHGWAQGKVLDVLHLRLDAMMPLLRPTTMPAPRNPGTTPHLIDLLIPIQTSRPCSLHIHLLNSGSAHLLLRCKNSEQLGTLMPLLEDLKT